MVNDGLMPQKQFANLACRSTPSYAWQGSSSFAKRQRQLSPEQYEIVDVRTSRGMNRAMLFSQAILLAEWEADAPFREAMAVKRERWRAMRGVQAVGAALACIARDPT
jgi:hypothetical protein